jgi:uncharacterized membrane protein YedE/YeeE
MPSITINWPEFTPFLSLFGGILIGIAAIMLMAFKGRILGISGIIGSLMQIKNTPSGHFSWRILFLIGVSSSPWIYQLFAVIPPLQINADMITLSLSGLLVGFGTRMGSGCTSGHAVCGLARFSTRSLIATLTFMASGFITTYFLYHGA